MSIVITAATSKLGRFVVQNLLDRGVAAGEIAAVVRDTGKAADLAALGVDVRKADYDDPAALRAAIGEGDKVLLISSNAVGARVQGHRNVVEAAAASKAALIAYTSVLNADTTTLLLAADHKATEAAVKESGLPYVFLRNGWYMENITENLGPALEHGAILGSAGDGRIAGATRNDYAAAAAAVLAGDGHANKVYELAGDAPYTVADVAAEVSAQSGRTVAYQDLPVGEYVKVLAGFGIPEAFAEILADSDAGIARGELDSGSADLRTLIGRPSTPLADAVAAALKS